MNHRDKKKHEQKQRLEQSRLQNKQRLDRVLRFFQNAPKFKARYATLGFSDEARLDEGDMWPTSFALKELTPVEEARIVALVNKAIS